MKPGGISKGLASDWDALAGDFSGQVLEIADHDLCGVIAATAKKLGDEGRTAVDFGCGAGAVTRLIAPFFKRVMGVDFAPKLVAAARQNTEAANVDYAVCDLSADNTVQFACDVGFCVNVLIGENPAVRERIARNVVANIGPGGYGVFVTPSLEAVIRTYQVGLLGRSAAGMAEKEAVAAVDGWVEEEVVSLPLGLVKMGGVATKHYLCDELAEFLSRRGLRDIAMSRVSYPWREALGDMEIDPDAEPPWDWMAVGRKA